MGYSVGIHEATVYFAHCEEFRCTWGQTGPFGRDTLAREAADVHYREHVAASRAYDEWIESADADDPRSPLSPEYPGCPHGGIRYCCEACGTNPNTDTQEATL